MLDTIPISGLWAVVSKLPAFILRRFFPPAKLAQLIYVDIKPRSRATLDLGQAASFTIYLQVINLSPFVVELDRASFRFYCGGQTINASILNKQEIQPGATVVLSIRENIPDGHANTMVSFLDRNPQALDGSIEFNCKLHSFAKNIGYLDGINLNVYGQEHRQPPTI
jgi:hypothetical protein